MPACLSSLSSLLLYVLTLPLFLLSSITGTPWQSQFRVTCICLTCYTYVPGLFSRSTQVSQVTNFCLWATEQLSFLNKLKCWAPRILWLGTFGHLFNFLRLESWCTVNIPRTVYTTKWKIYCKEKNNLGLPWSSHVKSKQEHFQLVFNLDWYKKYFGDKTYLHKNSWSLRWWKRNIKHQNCYIPTVRG